MGTALGMTAAMTQNLSPRLACGVIAHVERSVQKRIEVKGGNEEKKSALTFLYHFLFEI